MNNALFSADEVFSAYKKLKHYFYYDNTSLFIRKRISDFEAEIVADKDENFDMKFMNKMEEIAQRINGKNANWWKTYFKKHISYKITPKSFLRKDPVILTNNVEGEKIYLERINIFFDAPIEIHIIAVLWLMCAGRFFSKIVDGHNYAYKLDLTENEDEQSVVNGLRLYKPYFIQYQNWRDNAISKAEQLLDEKKDVVILSLDIKEYFNSVKINLSKIEEQLYTMHPALQDDPRVSKAFYLLNLINSIYSDKIKEVKPLNQLEENETILPIGLLSSGILGNIYMLGFDEEIRDKLNPAYYGRYVDDLLFVFSNVSVNHSAIYPINNFLSKYFVERGLFQYDNLKELKQFYNPKTKLYQEPHIIDENFGCNDLLNEAQNLKFKLDIQDNLIVQSKKVILQAFDHKESRAIINKFKKKLEENRSEFRFLPDEDEVDREFDEDAFSMHYSDSVNKLRSIKEFSEDKYGASKYLASKIFASSYSDEKPDKDTTHQLITFFKGTTGLLYHSLWEKVNTYFLINKQSYALIKFFRQIIRCIDKIDYTHLEDLKNKKSKFNYAKKIKEDLTAYFKLSLATPLALNPSFAFNELRKTEDDFFIECRKDAMSIRHANLFRHALVSIPALNYTNYLLNENNYDLIDCIGKEIDGNNLELNKSLFLLAPRYVHFHELNILQIYKTIHSITRSNKKTIKVFNNILDSAFEDYWKINYTWRYQNDSGKSIQDRKVKLKTEYFEIHPDEDELDNYNSITVKSWNAKSVDKKIALANIKVEQSNIKRSILGNPNASKKRRQDLFKLINLVEDTKCDLLVLPEVSIPYQWIKLLAYRSQQRDIGIIAGLEHWINNFNFAFNFMVTILPIRREKYSTCLIKIRLKNHYSHEEKRQLKGYRLLIPGEFVSKEHKNYDLFHWRNIYFSVYNCFELADIYDRALFKSKVDFIVASEYNKDTTYFADIAGSWVRDVHCFFVQVNSSHYGDSRLIQPAKSFARDIIQIKGGENSTILTGKLEIEKLRDFQLMEYELQKELIENGMSYFKPTPPDFDRENVKRRIGNKEIHH